MASSVQKTITQRLPGDRTGDVAVPAAPRRDQGGDVEQVIRAILAPLASLKLTVALFAMSIVIVFAGSVAQVDAGIWTVVHDYFRCAFAYIPIRIFFPRSWNVPHWGFYFPGGWLIGGLLLTNLFAAHAIRFTCKARGRKLALGMVILGIGMLVTWLVISNSVQEAMDWAYPSQAGSRGDAFWRVLWRLLQGGIAAATLYGGCIPLFGKRAGIVVLHGGVILLLCSELITGLLAVEARMTIANGETVNFLDHSRTVELAIVDGSDPNFDQVVTVPGAMLAKGGAIRSERLPFDIDVVEYMPNSSQPIPMSDVGGPMQAKNKATAGNGKQLLVLPAKEGSGVEMGAEDAPTAVLELKDKQTGASMGRYVFSLWFYANMSLRQLPDVSEKITVGGKTYDVRLRPEREYIRASADREPLALRLDQFNHKTYIGTDTPSDYSSIVQLIDADRKVDRRLTIRMNDPLRYGGRTFYQSGFLPHDNGTVLQVVKNIGWMVPYVSCMIVAMGLAGHLGAKLIEFIERRAMA